MRGKFNEEGQMLRDVKSGDVGLTMQFLKFVPIVTENGQKVGLFGIF